MKDLTSHALTLLRTIRDSLSGAPSYEAASDAWYAFDDLKISLMRDEGHSPRERALVRDLQATLMIVTNDLQQQRDPNGDPVKMVVLALESSIIGRSLRARSDLVLSEDDVLSD